MSGEILRPERWAQVILLFQVPPDSRTDEELSSDVARAVSVSLAGKRAERCSVVFLLDSISGRAQLQQLERLQGIPPTGGN